MCTFVKKSNGMNQVAQKWGAKALPLRCPCLHVLLAGLHVLLHTTASFALRDFLYLERLHDTFRRDYTPDSPVPFLRSKYQAPASSPSNSNWNTPLTLFTSSSLHKLWIFCARIATPPALPGAWPPFSAPVYFFFIDSTSTPSKSRKPSGNSSFPERQK